MASVQVQLLPNKHQECAAKVRRDLFLPVADWIDSNDRHLTVGTRPRNVEAELGALSDRVKDEETRTRLIEGKPDGIRDGRVLEVLVNDAVDLGTPEVSCSKLREEAAIRRREPQTDRSFGQLD